MKIIAQTNEELFLVNLSKDELKQLLGITSYHIKDALDINSCIINNVDLKISNGFRTAEKLKNIIGRQAFQEMRNRFSEMESFLNDAENKFTNLEKLINI